MKKKAMWIILLAWTVGFGFVPNLFAQDGGTYTWQQKFKRGLLNTATFFVEIPQTIHTTTTDKNLLAGWTVGLITGAGQAIARLGSGLLDIVTCPFNFPVKGKGPLVDPEFVWEKPGVNLT